MKKIILPIVALAFAVVLNSCSSVKVLDSWKGDNVSTMKDRNILVIARTNNPQARYAFEDAITAQLEKAGFKATESYKKFPKLNPDKPDEKRQEMIKSILNSEGYDGVVISVIKDYEENQQTTTDGGYYAGAGYYPSYYPQYYGGFYGYYGMYGMPMGYSSWDSGVYMPTTTTTRTVKTYVLQTLAYDLTLPEDKQMVAIVTSKMEDPLKASVAADEYATAIAEALKNTNKDTGKKK